MFVSPIVVLNERMHFMPLHVPSSCRIVTTFLNVSSLPPESVKSLKEKMYLLLPQFVSKSVILTPQSPAALLC